MSSRQWVAFCLTSVSVVACHKGSVSGGATGVCSAEAPDGTCPAGTPCDGPTDCSSGFCNGSCQSSSCVPADGVKNGQESDVDCGGPDCPGCPVDGQCTADADSESDFCDTGTTTCKTIACGDGIRNGSEACDDNGTPYPTVVDDDLGGEDCTSFGFSGGTLACSPTCTYDLSHCSSGCGNGVRDGSEQCDGNDLGGQTCASLGYNAGPGLTCTAECSLDSSGCTSSACPTSCPGGGFCSASTGFLCQCPLFATACSASCTSLLTDPDNCGSCGHVCSSEQACSSGVCESSCTPPLVLCNRRCIDPQTDNNFCGATGACSNATDCTTTSRVCLSGACAAASGEKDYTGAGDAPTRCVGGGPPLDINTGLGCDETNPNDPNCVVPPSLGCTGDLAAVTFRYALCSCNDINTSHPLFADGFDSSSGPYLPHCEDGGPCSVPGSDNGSCSVDRNGDGHATCADDKGAGVGANGTYSDSQLTTVWGTLWASNGASYPNQSLPVTTVEQDLHIGNTLSGGGINVRGDGFVAHDISATGAFRGTLHQSSGATSNMSANAIDRSANPLVVPEACDCAPDKLIDVPDIVDKHACAPQGTAGCSGVACCTSRNNQNAAINLDPTVLDNIASDVRVDLPCGNYSFTHIAAGNNTTITIVVHGRTAIYVDTHIDVPKILNITLTDAAELDVFVKGAVCNNDILYVGSPAYPARVRFYAGGGTLVSGGSGISCAVDSTRAMSLKSIATAPI